MTEEYFKVLCNIIDRANELYDMFEKLAKLDDQKNTSFYLDALDAIKVKQDEYDDLLGTIMENKSFLDSAITFLKELKPSITNDDIFQVFQNKNILVLRRIYNDFVSLRKTDSKAFVELLSGYFKKTANENMTYNTYLLLALFYYDLELDYRVIELLQNKPEFNKIKYILGFLNPTVHTVLKEEYYAEVPHSFHGNTMIETEYSVTDEKKIEFKNAYGCIMFSKVLTLLKKNAMNKDYINAILRATNLYMDENTINELLESIKNEPQYKEVKSLLKYRDKDMSQANQFATKLDKNTMKIVSQIFEITKTIRDIYSSLRELEKAGRRNTPQYQSMLNYLALTIKEEQEYYDYFKVCPEDIPNATEYIFEILDKKNYRDFATEISMDEVEDELIVVRVAKRFHQMALDVDDYFYDYAEDDDIKLVSTEEDVNYIRHAMKNNDQLYNYNVLREIPLVEENNEEIKFKYNMAFLMSSIESELLKGNLDNLPDTFMSSLMSNTAGVNPEIISYKNNKYAFHRLTIMLDDVIEYNDYDVTGQMPESVEHEYYNNEETEDPEPEEYDEEMEEMSEEEYEQMVKEDEDYNTLAFSLFQAEFKSCLRFADLNALDKIKERVDEKYKYLHDGREKVFSILYNLIIQEKSLKGHPYKEPESGYTK